MSAGMFSGEFMFFVGAISDSEPRNNTQIMEPTEHPLWLSTEFKCPGKRNPQKNVQLVSALFYRLLYGSGQMKQKVENLRPNWRQHFIPLRAD